MKISLLNEKILFQKGVVVSDAIGNRKNAWEDYYSCFATIGGESRNEKSEAGQTIDDVGITFTVRYCNQLVDIMELLTNSCMIRCIHDKINNKIY